MPFIRRRIVPGEGNPFVIEIHTDALLEGDEIIEPTDRQRADLIARFPEQYSPAPVEVSAVEFVELDWQEAVVLVEATESAELLAVWYDGEHDRDRPRKSVLAAFALKGYGA